MLRAALLFYTRLMIDLKGMGFTVNPYDPCVTNRMVNGKQMTICWHVDNQKVSNVEKLAVAALALTLEKSTDRRPRLVEARYTITWV